MTNRTQLASDMGDWILRSFVNLTVSSDPQEGYSFPIPKTPTHL